MNLTTPVTIVMSCNVLAFLFLGLRMGVIWRRFLDVEERANRIPHLEMMVDRIAFRLGVPSEKVQAAKAGGD